jgi:hypothetical protein
MTSTHPQSGTIIDMEDMGLQEKLNFLKDNQAVKCMQKTELLEEHETTWGSNGLRSFKLRNEFHVQNCEYLSVFCVKVTVELELNGGHWSDNLCGESNVQIGTGSVGSTGQNNKKRGRQ